jgi:hypothetical protein
MLLRVYIRVCVCIYIYIYTHTHTCVRACVSRTYAPWTEDKGSRHGSQPCISACVSCVFSMQIPIHAMKIELRGRSAGLLYIYLYVCMKRVCTARNGTLCRCVCMYIYIYIYTHTHTHIYTIFFRVVYVRMPVSNARVYPKPIRNLWAQDINKNVILQVSLNNDKPSLVVWGLPVCFFFHSVFLRFHMNERTHCSHHITKEFFCVSVYPYMTAHLFAALKSADTLYCSHHIKKVSACC